MKKVAFLLATVVLFASCQQQFEKIKENNEKAGEYGTVVIRFGHSLTPQALKANGLPDIASSKMRLVVEQEGGQPTTKEYAETDEKKWKGRFAIGTVLKFTVEVTGKRGKWKGSGTHTVAKGENPVSIKLSKSAISLEALKFALKKSVATQGALSFELGFADGSPFFNKQVASRYDEGGRSSGKVPAFCRDRIGRTYVFYAQNEGASESYHIERITSEGEADSSFVPIKLEGNSLKYFDIISDHASDDVFAVRSTDGNKVEIGTVGNGGSLQGTFEVNLSEELIAMCVYNGVVATATNPKSPRLTLYELKNSSLNALQGAEQEMAGLLATKVENFAGEMKDESSMVVDLAIRDGSVYVLYTLNKSLQRTSFGGVCKFPYSVEGGQARLEAGKRIIGKAEYKRVNKVLAMQDEASELYGALKFVGFGEDKLYIADAGRVYSYDAGSFNLIQNKNRLMQLNTKDESIAVSKNDMTPWQLEKKPIDVNINPILFYSESESGSAGVATAGPARIASIAIHLEEGSTLSSTSVAQLSANTGFKYVFDNSGCFYLLSQNGNKRTIERYTKVTGQYEKDASFVIAEPEVSAKIWSCVLYDSKARELYLVDGAGEIYRYVTGDLKKLSKGELSILARSKVAIHDDKVFFYKAEPTGAGQFLSYAVGKDAIDSSKSEDLDALFKTTLKIDSDRQIYAMEAYDGILYVSYFVDTNSERNTYIGAINLKQKTAVSKLLYNGNLGERNCILAGYNKTKKEVKLSFDAPTYDYDGRIVGNSNKYTSCKVAGSEIAIDFQDAPTGTTWAKEWDMWGGMKEIMLFSSDGLTPLRKDLGYSSSYYSVGEENLNAPMPSDMSIKDNVGTWSTYNKFCYDQLGNFYCLRRKGSGGAGEYGILRLKLGNDGKYNFENVNSGITPSSYTLVNGVADFEKNFLMTAVYLGNNRFRIYYTDDNSNALNKTIITAIEFGDETFTSATKKSWKLVIDKEAPTALADGWKVRRDVTALHANKDGLFVAVREMETRKIESDAKIADKAYNIIVKKYEIKDGTYTYDAPTASMDIVASSTNRKNTGMYSDYSGILNSNNVTLTTYTREIIQDMFAYNGTLYALTYKHTGTDTQEAGDSAPNSQLATSEGIIWKLGNNTKEFTGVATSLHKRETGENKWEFAPQHFIAVKPKKLVIASNGFTTRRSGGSCNGTNKNKVFFLKTDDDGLEEKETKARFTFKTKEGTYTSTSGFEWG